MKNKSAIVYYSIALLISASSVKAQLTSASFFPGQSNTLSANYQLDHSMDLMAGPLATSSNYSQKPGFIGQLNDVKILALTAENASVDEGTSNQMFAGAIMDDDTMVLLDPNEVNWGPAAWPLSGVTADGLAGTLPVFQSTLAVVEGIWSGTLGEGVFIVNDSIPDNFPPVNGDELDDSWQLVHFDTDHDNALDSAEAALAAPDADGDRDGQNNLFESLAGYLPLNPESQFHFSIVDVTDTEVNFRLSKIVPGTSYTLRSEADLTAETPWTTAGAPIIPDSEQMNFEFTDPIPAETKHFYYLELEKTP